MRNAIRNGTTRWTRWVALTLWIPIMAIAQASTAFEETVFIEGIEGGLYSGFEFTIEMDETVEPSPDQPETMPRITVTGLVGPHGAETPVQSLVFDEEFWGQVAEFVDAVGLEWLEGLGEDGDSAGGSGPGAGPGSGNDSGSGAGLDDAEIRDATEDLLAFIQVWLSPHAVVLDEFKVALEEHEFRSELRGAASIFPWVWEPVGCSGDFWTAIWAQKAAIALHVPLMWAFASSKGTCLSGNLAGIIACGNQFGWWIWGWPFLVAPYAPAYHAYSDLHKVVKESRLDGIGTRPDATKAYAESIARNAKVSEQYALLTSNAIPIPMLHVYNIGAIALSFPPSLSVLGVVTGEISALGNSLWQWGDYHQCQRDVIGPRFEASSVRVRTYLLKQDGTRVPYAPHYLPLELTAMSREVAMEMSPRAKNIWAIDAEKIFEEFKDDPEMLPIFNEATQSQPLSIQVCEGVVIGRDPNWLLLPLQKSNTPYVLTPDPHGTQEFPFFGDWWNGIGLNKTVLRMPLPAATTHRACEDGADGMMIDNDNDGLADDNEYSACGDNYEPGRERDPRGELEEDVYLHPAGEDVIGETTWEAVGHIKDMRCTGMGLDLVSKKEKISGGHVKQEVVLDVASYWTQESDGESPYGENQHPQDSTQIRFLIEDTNWGEPRPHGCYAWDDMTSRWSCKVGAPPECPCGGGVGGGPGL